MDIKQIREVIAKTEEGKAPEPLDPPPEKTVEELGEFKFAEGKDQIGLPHEHKAYVKRGCNDCYGRGYVIQTYGGRRYQLCGCVHKGYTRLRKEVETKVARWLANRLEYNAKLDEAAKLREVAPEEYLNVSDEIASEYRATIVTNLGL